jgi:hypothetical protein
MDKQIKQSLLMMSTIESTITPTIKTEIALIDGDIFRYEVGAIETTHPFLPNVRVPGDVQLIEKILDERINGILQAVGCDDYIIFLTGKGNFREKIAVTEKYKGHRAGKEKPYHWDTVDSRLKSYWKAQVVQGHEADDVLGISQRAYTKAGIISVICSRDKDLRMVPGYHYSWACGEHQKEKPLYLITDQEAERFFWNQMLIGDWSTDAIPGCAKIEDAVWKTGERAGKAYRKRNGIGEKKAEGILVNATNTLEYYNCVKVAYQEMFPDTWSEQMREQGRLLYIGQTAETLWDLPTGVIHD